MNLENFRDYFEIYRGKLRHFNKTLNKMYLNILSNFSEMSKKPNYTHTQLKLSNGVEDNEDDINMEYAHLLKIVASDLKLFFRITYSNKRYPEFKDKKTDNIVIQEVISRILRNLTIFPQITFYLSDSPFFDDLIEFLFLISDWKETGKDFVAEFLVKSKKHMTEEAAKACIVSTVENCIIIMLNIWNIGDCNGAFYENTVIFLIIINSVKIMV
jgi:hypothetical protein